MTQIAIASDFVANYPPRLQVMASAINDAVTTPHGVHLRWFSPKSLPRVSKVDLYRFDPTSWNKLIGGALRTSTIDLSASVRTNWADKNQHRLLTEIDALLVTPVTDDKRCLIRLSEPAIAIQLNFRSERSSHRVSVFHRSAPIYEGSVKDGALVEGPGITDILVRLPASEVLSISVAYESAIMAELSESRTLQPIAGIAVPETVDAAYKLATPDVNSKLRNRFVQAESLDLFAKQYPPEQVKQLVDALSDHLIDKNPIRNIDSQFGASATQVSIGSSLNLALLDPNIARLAGAYYTDQKAESDKDWRYLLKGQLKQDVPKFVAGYARSRKPPELPSLDNPPVAKQLPGISYFDRKPLGRLGVFTDKKAEKNSSALTVMVDVDRIVGSNKTSLTAKRPALYIGEGAVIFTDTKRPIDSKSTYAVRPIDLFGRVGKPVKTKPVTVQDLAAPIPPTQLAVRVDQTGFPWTAPADLQLDSKGGNVTGTFCYGEGANTLSPDATKAHVRWYAGSAQNRPADFNSWNHLASVELKPPIETQTKLTSARALAGVTLSVAEIKFVKESAEFAPQLPVVADNRELASVPLRSELLLDRALLEPDLFTGYKGVLNGVDFIVQSSTAGVAHDDDASEDKSLCARLIIAADISNAGPGTARLSLPLVGNLTLSQLNSALQVGTPATFEDNALLADLSLKGQSLPSPAGGELAIDLHYEMAANSGEPIWSPTASSNASGQQETVVARLVSEPVRSAGGAQRWNVLVRLRPIDYVKLRISALKAPDDRDTRVYPPYVFGVFKLGIGVDADIRIDLDPAAKFENLSFCIAAMDGNGTTGPASSPIESRIIAPPPAPPSPPFPREIGIDAPAGYAGVPDQLRESRVAVGWQSEDEPSIRYELSRALDTSIIALDKSLWLAGGLPHQANYAAQSIDVSITGSSTLQNGLLRVDLDLSSQQTLLQLQTFRGGRISVHHLSQNSSASQYHRIVSVKQHNDDVYCLCKTASDARTYSRVDTSESASLTQAPDYSAVLADDNALKTLANTRDEQGRAVLDAAFGVITGTPLKATDADSFHDVVPGPARNRYFYRLRNLANSGAASAWSEPSVTFNSFAPAPEHLHGLLLESTGTKWLLSWDRPKDTIDRLEVAIIDADNLQINSHQSTVNDFVDAPRFMPGRIMLFESPIEIPVPDDATDNVDGLLANWKVTLDSSTTPLDGRFIKRVEQADNDNLSLRISGFKAANPLSFATQAIVSNGNTPVQLLALTNPERNAVLVDALGSQSDALKKIIRIQIRASIQHNGIWLRGVKSEVNFDA